MKIDIELVKKLRAATGVGLTDAKKALQAAAGDYDKAFTAMRAKGLARAADKADRAVGAGLIHSYVHGGKIGVLVELNCETDFVARTEAFKQLANDLALHIAASAPHWLSPEDVPKAELDKEKKIIAAELARQAKPAAVQAKITDGKLEKFYAETCLLRQPFVKDPDQTVADIVAATAAKVGENIVIRRFRRLVLGQDHSS